MLRTRESDLIAEIDRLKLSLKTEQGSIAADQVVQDGTTAFIGLGGEMAACVQLQFNIMSSGVALRSIEHISTSILTHEGLINYTVSGTEAQIDSFCWYFGGKED
jgi:hypothetical protein